MCESLKNSATFAHYQPLFRFQGPNSYLFVSPFGLKRLLPPPGGSFFYAKLRYTAVIIRFTYTNNSESCRKYYQICELFKLLSYFCGVNCVLQ